MLLRKKDESLEKSNFKLSSRWRSLHAWLPLYKRQCVQYTPVSIPLSFIGSCSFAPDLLYCFFFFFTSPFPLCHSSQPLYWNWGQRAVHPNLIMPERIVSVWYSWIKQKRHLTKTWVLCLETKFSSPSCHTRVRVCVFIGLGIPQYLTRKWWKSWLKRKVWGPLLRLLPSWPRPGGSLMPGWFAASVDEWMNRQMMDGWIICNAVFYYTLEYIYKTKSLCG